MVTFVDQGVMSAVSFGAGLAFIYCGSVDQYALYTLFVSAFLLIASAQNAVINTPMMVLTPRLSSASAANFGRGLLAALLLIVVIVCAFTTAAAVALASPARVTWQTAVLVAACFVPQVLRDHFRAQEYALMKPELALRRDVVYSLVALTGVASLAKAHRINAGSVIAAVGVSAAAVAIRPTLRALVHWPPCSVIRSAVRDSWQHARWSLVGSVSSWVQGYAYVIVPFVLLGRREVAFLAASRLVVTPVVLLAQSWGNYLRPALSRSLAHGQHRASLHLLVRSSVVLIGMLGAYAVLAIAALDLLPGRWVPVRYRAIGWYIAVWALIVAIQIVRSNASSLLQASLAFRRLALWGTGVAAFTVVCTIGLVLTMGTIGALVGLVAGEVALAAVLLVEALRTLRIEIVRPGALPA